MNTIIVACPIPKLKNFYYLPNSDGCIDVYKIGHRVKVPFGNRSMIGIIIGFENNVNELDFKLKKASLPLDDEPVFTQEIIKICIWIHEYYVSPLGEVFHTALPGVLRDRESINPPLTYVWRPLQSSIKLTDKQSLVVEKLKNGMDSRQVVREGISLNILKRLELKGVVEKSTYSPSLLSVPNLIPLNSMQQKITNTMLEKMEGFNANLLYGVTGSGKTEVYMHLIQECFSRGRSCLLLVPEISLTPQTIARFEKGLGIKVAALHSNLSLGKRFRSWWDAKHGNVQMVIGTRLAVMSPLKNLGLIVVDEEHDSSFKQQRGVRYSARDVAVVRAKFEGIPIILGSATPSLESLLNCRLGKYALHTLHNRAKESPMPKISVIDTNLIKVNHGISNTMLDAMKKHLNNGHQVLIFLNRRGFAPSWRCLSCGWDAQCQACDVPFTLHQSINKLICHHCENSQKVLKVCPSCNASELLPFGVGTQRLEDSLSKEFPGYKVLRVDRDTIRKKGDLDVILSKVNDNSANILVGTQILAKGHDFKNVTFVGVLGIDYGFNRQDLRSLEKIGQLLVQVAGRSGRHGVQGEVFLQTMNPEHELFAKIKTHNYLGLADDLLEERESLEMPPYFSMATFFSKDLSMNRALKTLDRIKSILLEGKVRAKLFGPIPAVIEKRHNLYQANLVLIYQKKQNISCHLHYVIEKIEELKGMSRWGLDIDPIELS